MKRLVRLIAGLSSTLRGQTFSGTVPEAPQRINGNFQGQFEVSISPRDLPEAIQKSQDYIFKDQAPEGFWVDELEADTSLTSEYLMLRHFLGIVDPVKQKKAVHYLIDSQLPEGGWNIFYEGPSNISSSIKAYFALKLSGISSHEPFMRRGRQNILERGGVVNANVFTKIGLALFGQYDWRGIPLMPPELILLPRWFYFNLYEVSYWSRAVIVPLLIIFDKKPLCVISKDAGIDELYTTPKQQLSHRFQKDPQWITWKNFFITVDEVLKRYERHHFVSLRKRALKKAEDWLVDHIRGEGGLGAIYPAMANSVIALRCLGYPENHPMVLKGIREIEAMEVKGEDSLYLQPCHSPIWDTCLTMNALLDAGFPRNHPALVAAAHWLMSKQTTREGDWKIKVPQAEPGGWYFQFENEFYPDNDDTAVVLMALAKVTLPDEQAKHRAILRGLKWLLAMQCKDGGWGAFDVDNDKVIFNQIPFADHGALLDPSTSDLVGRVLEALGVLGYDRSLPQAAAGIQFARRNQKPEGCWYGRWGVNYIYGTWSVLAGLYSIGEDMGQPYIQRAADWLKSRQNPDGGWGESCESYKDYRFAGVGKSTASQTAWAILGLLKAGRLKDSAVCRGIDYLLSTQDEDGTWPEPEFTGTGFPRVFYLRYHMYSKYFPLWALSLYQSLRTKGRTLSDDVRIINRLNGYYKLR
jgi:squalene-hopene/tetraprenyl-beta-curcumene cyclase